MRRIICAIVALIWGMFCAAGPLSAGNPPAPAAPAVPPLTLTLNEKTLPTTPGYHIMKGSAVIGQKTYPVACGILLPKFYFQTKDPLPIIMTLHNYGLSGNDGGDGLIGEGLGLLAARNDPDTRGSGDKPKNPIKIHDDAQCIVLVPQCTPGVGGWNAQPVPRIMAELITQVAARYHADGDRVYLTGFSYGGSSTWRLALEIPDRFAAIVPVDGRATPKPAEDVLKLMNVPIFLAVGGDDGGFTEEAQRMRMALLAAGHPKFVYRIIPHGNHWCYASLYTDPEFWTWLFAQRRKGASSAATSIPASQPAGGNKAAGKGARTTASPAADARHTVLCQYFRDIAGAQIKDLAGDAAFPRFPNEQVYLDQLQLPLSDAVNFGSVMRALITAPQTGEFMFYISGQDQCELYLSTDESPEHAARIAYVPNWSLPGNFVQDPHQASQAMKLAAGKSYYIEARHKHGPGDSHLCVAWQLPDGVMEAPIPASRFRALPMTSVPPPQVISIEPKTYPAAPGAHAISAQVNYLNRTVAVSLELILPRGYEPLQRRPALVYTPASDAPATRAALLPDPAHQLVGQEKLASWSQLIVIVPQCPAGQSWQKPLFQAAAAAAVEKLLSTLPVDAERIYLTADGSGTAAAWSLAAHMPGRFAVVAPFCPVVSEDARLAQALQGTKVHITTGVQNGIATDAANRMKDALAVIRPEADVFYEMQMGSEAAAAHYASPEFYKWLLGWHRPAGGPAAPVFVPAPTTPSYFSSHATGIVLFVGLTLFMLVAILYLPRLVRSRVRA